jgi:hypothetical protein
LKGESRKGGSVQEYRKSALRDIAYHPSEGGNGQQQYPERYSKYQMRYSITASAVRSHDISVTGPPGHPNDVSRKLDRDWITCNCFNEEANSALPSTSLKSPIDIDEYSFCVAIIGKLLSPDASITLAHSLAC